MTRSGLPDPKLRVAVTADPIDLAELTIWAGHPRAGAVVTFVGTVRDHAPGREGVTHLEYEVYDELVEPKMREIVDEAVARWPVLTLAAIHRTGRIDVGGAAVAVVATSAHRNDAFEAARYVIDEVKTRAPIWKKEHWLGGAEWVREDLAHGGGP